MLVGGMATIFNGMIAAVLDETAAITRRDSSTLPARVRGDFCVSLRA